MFNFYEKQKEKSKLEKLKDLTREQADQITKQAKSKAMPYVKKACIEFASVDKKRSLIIAKVKKMPEYKLREYIQDNSGLMGFIWSEFASAEKMRSKIIDHVYGMSENELNRIIINH